MLSKVAIVSASISSRLLVNLGLFIVIARIFGPETFGMFMFFLSIATLLSFLTDYGMQTHVLRLYTDDKAQFGGYISDFFTVKTLLSAITVGTAFVVAVLVLSDADLLVFVFLLLSMVFHSFSEFYSATLRAAQAYGRELFYSVSANAVTFITVLVVAYVTKDIVMVAGAYLGVRLINFLAIKILCERWLQINIKLRRDVSSVTKVLRSGKNYFLDSALTTTMSNVDVIIVYLFLGTYASGIYQAGQKLVLGAVSLLQAFAGTWIPKLSNSKSSSNNRVAVFQLLAYTAIVGLVFIVIFYLVPNQIVSLLYGEDYRDLVDFLFLFGVILFVRYVVGALGMVLTAFGMQHIRVKGLFLIVILFFPLSIWMLSFFELKGMLLAIVISYGLLGIYFTRHISFTRSVI